MLAADNKCFLAQRQAQLGHTNSSTDGIIILVHVSHNKNTVSLQHLLMNRLRHNTCTHTRTFGTNTARAAKELRILILHNNSLVAAASQCQIQALIGIADKLLQRHTIASYTNTYGRRYFVAAADFTHLIKYHELIFHHIHYGRLRKAHQAAFLIHTADKALLGGSPLRQQLVDFAIQIGHIGFTQPAHNLFVVIKAHIGQAQLIIAAFLAQQLIICNISQKKHQTAGGIFLFTVMLLRFYTVIAHTVIVVLNLNNLLSVTHAHQLKGILRQRQNLLRLFALQIAFAGPGGK